MKVCAYCNKIINPQQEMQGTYDGRDFHLHCFNRYPHQQETRMNNIDEAMSSMAYAHRRMRAEMILENGKPFFILFNPGSEKPSRALFESQEEAFKIAELMARKNPDEKFYVMQSVGFSQTQQPVVNTMLLKELSTTVKAAPKPRKR